MNDRHRRQSLALAPLLRAVADTDPAEALAHQIMDPPDAKLDYPICTCGAPICAMPGNHVCNCTEDEEFTNFREQVQLEFEVILKEIEATRRKLKAYKNAPFRPLRNAAGFGAASLSAINITIAHLAGIGLAVGMPLLLIPPALFTAYIFFRGNREENEIIDDEVKALRSKENEILTRHKEYVAIRYQQFLENKRLANESKNGEQKNQQIKYLDCESQYSGPKEKRRDLANSFSHFLGGSIATMSVLNAIIQFTFFTSIVAAPVAWPVAVFIACAVGAYFCYSRYKYLQAKKSYEIHNSAVTNRLNTLTNDLIECQNNTIKQKDERTAQLEKKLAQAEEKSACLKVGNKNQKSAIEQRNKRIAQLEIENAQLRQQVPGQEMKKIEQLEQKIARLEAENEALKQQAAFTPARPATVDFSSSRTTPRFFNKALATEDSPILPAAINAASHLRSRRASARG